MRRTIASIAVAALMFGATAVAVSAITAEGAGAQEITEDPTTPTPDTPTIDDGTTVRPDGFGRRGHGPGPGLDVAAATLGLTVDELRAELESGKTVADVASEQGVSVDDLVAAIVADVTADIQAKVDAGELDADRAAEIIAGLTERVTAMVNGEVPVRGDGCGRRGHGPAGGFFGGSGVDDATVEETSISA